MTISFNQCTYIVNENEGLLQAVLILSKSVRTEVTVQVGTNDNTATGDHLRSLNNILLDDTYLGGDIDYDSGPYNVTFPSGEKNAAFTITINNDTVLEYDETFNLTIIESSLPENFILGEIYLAKVTIINDGGSGKYAVQPLMHIIANVGKICRQVSRVLRLCERI